LIIVTSNQKLDATRCDQIDELYVHRIEILILVHHQMIQS